MKKTIRWRNSYQPEPYFTTTKLWILLHTISLELEDDMQEIEPEKNYREKQI
ncbi:hypothetical protein ACHYZU_000682 [Listeria monocytogenes]